MGKRRHLQRSRPVGRPFVCVVEHWAVEPLQYGIWHATVVLVRVYPSSSRPSYLHVGRSCGRCAQICNQSLAVSLCSVKQVQAVAIKERSHGAPGVHGTDRTRTHLAEHSRLWLLHHLEHGTEQAMRESIDFCNTTMHKGVIDDRHVALFPMNPGAHSPTWVGTEQIMVVEPAAINGIDVIAATRRAPSGGVDNVHRVRPVCVKGFMQGTPR